MNDGFKRSNTHVLYISCVGLGGMCNTRRGVCVNDRVWGERCPHSLVYERSSHGNIRVVNKPITGTSYRGLHCFEPQKTVWVLTGPFSVSPDIRGLDLLKGDGKSLNTGPKRLHGVCGVAF